MAVKHIWFELYKAQHAFIDTATSDVIRLQKNIATFILRDSCENKSRTIAFFRMRVSEQLTHIQKLRHI